MSKWRVTDKAGWDERTGKAVYTVTKDNPRLSAGDQDELKALLAGWISVDERLPNAGQEVLACRLGKRKTFGPFLIKKTNSHLTPWKDLDGDRCEVTPTHWMPLPEAPTN